MQFSLVPFKIRVGEREYVDLATLNVPQMLQAMTDYNGASTTACPSPEEWAELFLMADKSIALTISHNLSGSYNAALAAREMVLEEHPEKQIFVLDTLSCSGALAGAAELANKLIPSAWSWPTGHRKGTLCLPWPALITLPKPGGSAAWWALLPGG